MQDMLTRVQLKDDKELYDLSLALQPRGTIHLSRGDSASTCMCASALTRTHGYMCRYMIHIAVDAAQ